MPETETAVRIESLAPRACLRLQAWTPEIERRMASIANAGIRVLPLAPNDYLLVSSDCSSSELRRLVASYLSADGHALVDQSDGHLALEIAGPAAPELLAKGCGLYIHPREFSPGQSTRTRLGGIPIVVTYLKNPLRFELIVSRSYGPYLEEWLADAAVEFGLPAIANPRFEERSGAVLPQTLDRSPP